MRDAFHRARAERRVGHAPREHLHAEALQQARVGLLLGAVGESQHDDLRAAAAGVLRQMGADEAGAPGHEQLHPNAAASAVAIRSLA